MKNLHVRWLGARLRILSWAALAAGSARAAVQFLSFVLVEFRPRADDLFVCSFPKSGTTLMQMMLFQLTTDGDVERIPHLDAFSPWFELDLADSASSFEALPSPRIFKTHLKRRWLPRQGKLIYLVRDVRDVAVSAYHHCALINGREIQLDPFLERFLRGHPMFGGSWFRHLESWWPHRGDPDVLFVEYDEMIADLEGTIRRVAAFCGLPVPETEMPRILERCGIAYMKAHGDKLDPRLHLTAPREQGFLGRGRPGTGRRELSPRQQALLHDRLAELARDLGGSPEEPALPWLRPESG